MKTATILAAAIAIATPAFAFDHGFNHDTERSKWFTQLKRPEKAFYPNSCCGDADAYEADIYSRNPDGSYEVTITDGSEKVFPDGSLRPGIKTGSQIHVEKDRVNPPIETQGNPTGHAWIFVSASRGMTGDTSDEFARPGYTYCFAPLPEES